MSRRATCRAGWSRKAWGDWRTESHGCGGCRTAHGSNGVLGDIGIHILDFASYGAGARHRPRLRAG